MSILSASDIERVFRAEYGRAVAVLIRVFGDIDVAEDAVQDAFTSAVQRWPSTGLPPSPAGWIVTTARNRAIDRLRRESSRQERHARAALLHARDEPAEEGAVRDDRLRLIFTCCHPALVTGVQVALTRLLGGLTTTEIARGFLNARQLRTWCTTMAAVTQSWAAGSRPGLRAVRAARPGWPAAAGRRGTARSSRGSDCRPARGWRS